jgi:hypothetical protein
MLISSSPSFPNVSSFASWTTTLWPWKEEERGGEMEEKQLFFPSALILTPTLAHTHADAYTLPKMVVYLAFLQNVT